MLDKVRLVDNIRGIIRVDLIDRAGKLVWSHTHRNMICVSIRESMANLIVGANLSTKKIAQVAVGTDGTVYDNTIVDFAQTDPANKFSKNLVDGSWTFPETNQITINWQLDYTEPASPMIIQEYGLFSGDGLLIARAVKPAISKTEEVSLLGSWTLIFN